MRYESAAWQQPETRPGPVDTRTPTTVDLVLEYVRLEKKGRGRALSQAAAGIKAVSRLAGRADRPPVEMTEHPATTGALLTEHVRWEHRL